MLTVDYDILGLKDGERILDVGCGDGRHSSRACQQAGCTVYALDLDNENVRQTSYLLHLMDEGGETAADYGILRGDALRLPFPDGRFDKVICTEVLEHVSDDRQAVRELTRVLKDDGSLAVSVPTWFSESIYWRLSWRYHNTPGGHIRKYRKRQLIRLLGGEALTVYSTRRKHGLHFAYWLLRCLFGIDRKNALLPSLYHRFLVWDLMKKKRPVRWLESALNPLLAKSLVVYARKTRETPSRA
jgi:2-polyprenyl-3-methyl-5-hydroxy-6-metoxy-1,4-benzoquinol methylase